MQIRKRGGGSTKPSWRVLAPYGGTLYDPNSITSSLSYDAATGILSGVMSANTSLLPSFQSGGAYFLHRLEDLFPGFDLEQEEILLDINPFDTTSGSTTFVGGAGVVDENVGPLTGSVVGKGAGWTWINGTADGVVIMTPAAVTAGNPGANITLRRVNAALRMGRSGSTFPTQIGIRGIPDNGIDYFTPQQTGTADLRFDPAVGALCCGVWRRNTTNINGTPFNLRFMAARRRIDAPLD